MEMRRFTAEHVATLLRRLAFRMNRAARSGNPESLHDLRVTIRRFSEALRIFQEFFPHRKAKKIRRRLRNIMDLAAEIRNRDIALGILREAGIPAGAPLLTSLAQERKQAKERLTSHLRRRSLRDIVPEWRRRLDL
jgi:CHAD domain-containing protein